MSETQPPLPPGPPPPGPPPQMEQQPFYQENWCFQNVPAISQLLLQEADAWRALLGLQAGVVRTARQMASAISAESDVMLEGAREAIEQRESGYFAALSQLAANCDALSSEALRLRSLRKARATTDTQAVQLLMQAHSDETLATGTSLSSTSATSVRAVTAELRQATQSSRQQIAQVRALMQAVQDRPDLRGAIGVTFADKSVISNFTTDAVFASVYSQSNELTDETLEAAMLRLCIPESNSKHERVPNVPARTVVRRQGDRRTR